MAYLSELVTLISLNLTIQLLNAGQVKGTFPVTNVTTGTPILVTSPAHGVPPPVAPNPPSRVVHGVISGVLSEVEANGPWILEPVDSDTFALYKIDAQGHIVAGVGTNAYAGGGVIQYAL